MHRLRAAMPHVDSILETDSHSLWWKSNPPITLDVVEFEDAISKADGAGKDTGSCCDADRVGTRPLTFTGAT